jgi:hypothetical protein
MSRLPDIALSAIFPRKATHRGAYPSIFRSNSVAAALNSHCGETTTILQERVVVFGTKLFGSKTRQMNGPPEPVASAGKVAAARRRADARIDAAKYNG